MKPPPRPADEEWRLEALRQFHWLTPLPETAFDNLAKLAALVCETPIALISFVDENREWFKSRVVWPAGEAPRDESFCGHTILQSGLCIVPDTSQDERFADNPMVAGAPRIRFYAGAPLVTAEG